MAFSEVLFSDLHAVVFFFWHLKSFLIRNEALFYATKMLQDFGIFWQPRPSVRCPASHFQNEEGPGTRLTASNLLFSFLFLSFQLFPQVGIVMIKPLREAYENYERMRIEEEAVKAAAAVSSTAETEHLQTCSSGTTQGQWSSKKLMGVSKEIRDMFHEKNKEIKPADEDKETLSRATIKTQVSK